MKTEPSKTIREVWAAKEAAYAETVHFKIAPEFFGHIRKNVPDLGLPRITAKPRQTLPQG